TVQCHRSTVYRELKRGSNGSHYWPNEAQVFSIKKRTSAHKYRIPKERVDFIRLLLESDWSPEQISS
ncbi:IS30 family transposase, partial [Vibrio atlanticus]